MMAFTCDRCGEHSRGARYVALPAQLGRPRGDNVYVCGACVQHLDSMAPSHECLFCSAHAAHEIRNHETGESVGHACDHCAIELGCVEQLFRNLSGRARERSGHEYARLIGDWEVCLTHVAFGGAIDPIYRLRVRFLGDGADTRTRNFGSVSLFTMFRVLGHPAPPAPIIARMLRAKTSTWALPAPTAPEASLCEP